MLNLARTTQRTAQEFHMLDTANLIGYSITYDDYGGEIKTPVINSGIQCGFSYNRTFDTDKRVWITTNTEATLRLPVGTVVSNITEVDITNRPTISGYWEVNGQPEFGNTATILNLRAFE